MNKNNHMPRHRQIFSIEHCIIYLTGYQQWKNKPFWFNSGSVSLSVLFILPLILLMVVAHTRGYGSQTKSRFSEKKRAREWFLQLAAELRRQTYTHTDNLTDRLPRQVSSSLMCHRCEARTPHKHTGGRRRPSHSLHSWWQTHEMRS